MPKLLVVDDTAAIREALKYVLTDLGYRVDVAENTESALLLILQTHYDLVLTDLYMPGENGFDLIKRIRRQWGKQLPVIVMTAYGSPDNAALAISEGISDFIIKPFEISTLTEAVNYALHKSNAACTASTPPPPSENPLQAQARLDFEKKFFGLSILDELSKTVHFSSEIDKIGGTLLDLVVPVLNPDRAALVIHQKQKPNFRFQTFYAREGSRPTALRPLDLELLKLLGETPQGLFAPQAEHYAPVKSWSDPPAGSFMALPFMRQHTLLGALLVYRNAERSPFQEEEFSFLRILANMTAIALENADLYDDLKTYFTSTIRALISTVEIKDPTLYGHSTRVARYSLMVAKALALNEVELRRLEYLALLHDIGKIGIPEPVLCKDSLDADEERLFRSHVTLGETIVRSIHFLPGGDKIIRHHHECFNGSGYPDGLAGSNIPLFSRIISLADRFDLHMHTPPPHSAATAGHAFQALRGEADIQLDPALVQIFEKAYQGAADAKP